MSSNSFWRPGKIAFVSTYSTEAYIPAFEFINRTSTGGWRADMQINKDGQVLIGTVCTQWSNYANAKLMVNGTIYSKAVTVKLTDANGCFPDYVFNKDYKLQPLSEVEEYIKEHNHLPEVPSAQEVDKEGMDLADMNMILLKKIEEMTLHMIEINKKVTTLSEENKKLSKEVQSLK
jgi:hypothetical protein